MTEPKVLQEHKTEQRKERSQDQRNDHPKAVVAPPLGQQNHHNWRVHTERVRPQDSQHYHVNAPQMDSRRLHLNPPDYNQRRIEQLQQQLRHVDRHSGYQSGYPQFAYPQYGLQDGNWMNRMYGDPRPFHQRQFQYPYGGSNNFYGEDCEDNYYGGRFRRDNDRDDFIPRMVEGILDGILTGTLIEGLDKLGAAVSGKEKYSDEVELIDEKDQKEKLDRAYKEEFSPDKQLSASLEFSPPGQTSGRETRFERTG